MSETVKNKAEKILKKFHDGNASAEEIDILRGWLAQKSVPSKKELIKLSDNEKTALLSKINQDIDGVKISRLRARSWQYGSVAALLIACLGFLYYFSTNNDIPAEAPILVEETHDILPGTDDAIVEFADGRKVALNPTSSSLENLDGVKVDLSSGIISFEGMEPISISSDKKDETEIRTKNGGQYTVILPDGTLTKLNSNSSIRFASNFTSRRFLKLSGEVYLEVKRDVEHPFVVEAGHQNIKVLGTKFNIKSYPEENITTTSLISGSLLVRSSVSIESRSYILKPGESAKNGDNLQLEVHKTFPAKEVAWTDGSFYFDGETIEEVLTVLARWYDIHVRYEYIPSKDMRFGGLISKDKKLSTVLSLLEDQTGLKFHIRGREVIVQK